MEDSKLSSSPLSSSVEEKVDFGFAHVPVSQKTLLVQDVFHRVASRYDVMNDVMSFGIHRHWKDVLVSMLPLRPGMNVLDVAGGTGDVGQRVYQALYKRQLPGTIRVCDLNPSMLKAGKEKSRVPLDWICGNAECLPFAASSVDAYTIAFGFRNVTHRLQALEEAYRVLKPGGVFLCLEFSKVTLPVLDKLYHAYNFSLLPWLGEKIAQDRSAYQYLAESIEQFLTQEEFVSLMKEAGFQQVSYRNLAFGVTAIHQGWKL